MAWLIRLALEKIQPFVEVNLCFLLHRYTNYMQVNMAGLQVRTEHVVTSKKRSTSVRFCFLRPNKEWFEDKLVCVFLYDAVLLMRMNHFGIC